MIEINCNECEKCNGTSCVIYGDDVYKAVQECADDGFKNYSNCEKKKEYTWETTDFFDIWGRPVFGTIKECIEDAKRTEELKDGDIILIGEVELYDFMVDEEAVLERIGEIAFENVGEVAEDWPSSQIQTRENMGELSESLTKCVKEWLTKHNDMPSFYSGINVMEVEIC